MGPSGCFTHIVNILDCLGQVFRPFYSRVFRGLTGSQRTPGFGASQQYRLDIPFPDPLSH